MSKMMCGVMVATMMCASGASAAEWAPGIASVTGPSAIVWGFKPLPTPEPPDTPEQLALLATMLAEFGKPPPNDKAPDHDELYMSMDQLAAKYHAIAYALKFSMEKRIACWEFSAQYGVETRWLWFNQCLNANDGIEETA